jgi:hypothetical protein
MMVIIDTSVFLDEVECSRLMFTIILSNVQVLPPSSGLKRKLSREAENIVNCCLLNVLIDPEDGGVVPLTCSWTSVTYLSVTSQQRSGFCGVLKT